MSWRAWFLGAIVLAISTQARADYPDKPVRIVVPVAAGGGVDVMARLLSLIHISEPTRPY